MDQYAKIAYKNSKAITLFYSTSFSSSSSLFAKDIQPHIFAIYGLVRIADEVVDSYNGEGALEILDDLETEVYKAIARGFSANTTVHAFALTAKKYGITKKIIAPFFASMRLDLAPQTYTTDLYEKYIHGSAEVVGLMCLRVFVGGDESLYKKLEPGACALGAAYQKVNFLRDLADDYKRLGRTYFPGVSYDSFDENAKLAIIKDISRDFKKARIAIDGLPTSSKKAVLLSYNYFSELLKKLNNTPAEQIKHQRVRIPNSKKLLILAKTKLSKEGS